MRSTPWAVLAVAMAAGGCAGPAPDEPPAAATSSTLLAEIGRDFWQLELDEQLWLQRSEGIPTTRLPGLSPEHFEERAAEAERLLERLQAVDPEALSHEEWIALESMRWDLEVIVETARHYWLIFPITPYAMNYLGVHVVFQSPTLETAADAERYLDLVGRYPAFVDALRAKLEGQMVRGILLPRAEIELILPTWKGLLAAPETVFSAAAGEPPAAAPDDFSTELTHLLESEVRPAWERLIAFLEGGYLAAAPEELGLAQYPGGQEYYRFLIRWDVSMDADPAHVHRLGLERVAAIGERMKEVRRELGFTGSRAEFHRALRTDPRFFAETPEEIGERLLGFVARIEPEIDAWFARRPRAPYAVERLGPDLEATMTYGYFQSPSVTEPRGVYYYNGSKLDERSLIEAQSLIYHELIPGHHFETALMFENESLPAYRKGAWHGGFAEGWGVYASTLADDMGMYQDPYDLYGYLASESFYASRLVVDTGVNHLGWSSRQAIEFMREHTLESETQIATETLRYGVDIPAQALTYGLGSLKIRELRERARQALGERYDVRRFHEAVLANGSMPLAVLEEHIDRLIERESR